jgi:hypothetical protein
MTIPINKLIRASIAKIAAVHANPVLALELEIAREKAWHDAYLDGGVIG